MQEQGKQKGIEPLMKSKSTMQSNWQDLTFLGGMLPGTPAMGKREHISKVNSMNAMADKKYG